MQRSERQGSSRWTRERKAMVGISAVVLMEVIERAVGLRSRGTRAVAAWWVHVDDSTRRDLRRAEADLVARVLSGSRRRPLAR